MKFGSRLSIPCQFCPSARTKICTGDAVVEHGLEPTTRESTARFATIRAWLTRSLQFHNPLVQIPGREEPVFAADLSSFKQSQGL